jgi:hypothetical protein
VRKPAPAPLTFTWPTSIDLASDGTVYVLETAQRGTIRRITPDGSISTIAR